MHSETTAPGWSKEWLIDIPGEIRYHVYEWLFRDAKVLVRYEGSNPTPIYSSPLLTIFATSKAVKHESQSAFHKEAVVHFDRDTFPQQVTKEDYRILPFSRLRCPFVQPGEMKLMLCVLCWIERGDFVLDELQVDWRFTIPGKDYYGSHLAAAFARLKAILQHYGPWPKALLRNLRETVPHVTFPMFCEDTGEQLSFELDREYNIRLEGSRSSETSSVARYVYGLSTPADYRRFQEHEVAELLSRRT